MTEADFAVGELLIRLKTGNVALILESRPSGRSVYGRGSTDDRLLYRVFENGQSFWKHDLQLLAEYKRPIPA